MNERLQCDRSDEPDPPISTDAILARCLGNAEVALTVLGHLTRQLDSVERELCGLPLEADRLADLAHSVRGSAGTVGAGALLEAAARMEIAARSGVEPVDLGDLLDEVRRCRDFIETARRELVDSPDHTPGQDLTR